MTSEDLKQVMEQYKLSAEQVAKACYVSVNTVYAWRAGQRNISKSAAAHIVRYLGERK